jgi:required for meiotic nuclear division protein 1
MQYLFTAYHLRERLKLKDLQKVIPFQPLKAAADEIVYKLGKNEYLFLYRFGAMVFFNTPIEIQKRELDRMINSLDIKEEIKASDDFLMETEGTAGTSVSSDSVKVPKLNYETISLVALVLAQSASLEYFEFLADEMLARSQKITKNLELTGKIEYKTQDLIRHIGFVLTTKHDIVSKLYILDKPEITWDDPSLDKLYNQLAACFELAERYKLLDYKFHMSQDSLEIISDLVSTRRAVLLEVLIILLIAVEVVLFVYQLFFK